MSSVNFLRSQFESISWKGDKNEFNNMLSKANNSPKSTKRESADIIHTEETCSMFSEMHKIKEYKCYLQHALEERRKFNFKKNLF